MLAATVTDPAYLAQRIASWTGADGDDFFAGLAAQAPDTVKATVEAAATEARKAYDQFGAWLETARASPIVPKDHAEIDLLLDTLILELALDDVYSEIDRRPDWAMIALRTLQDMLG